MRRIVKFVLLVMVLQLFSGCAAQVAKKKERFFWPRLPDIPRIEWLSIYSGSADFREKSFMDDILGESEGISLLFPVFVTADGNGRIYVSDQKLGGVVSFDQAKKNVHMLGGEPAAKHFQRTTGVAVDADGNIYVGDTDSKKITVFDASEKMTKVFDLSKDAQSIASFALDKRRKRIYVPDVKGHRVLTYDLDGQLLNAFGKRGDADDALNYPSSIALDTDGNLVVCDAHNSKIKIYTPDGKLLNKFGKRGDGIGELAVIKAAAVDSEGHIYVTDGKTNRVTIFNKEGETLLVFGGGHAQAAGTPITPGGFLMPMGIYIDQNDTIYVVDNMNERLQVFQYMNEKWLRENPVEGAVTPPATPPVAK